jgi:hypothetical protein
MEKYKCFVDGTHTFFRWKIHYVLFRENTNVLLMEKDKCFVGGIHAFFNGKYIMFCSGKKFRRKHIIPFMGKNIY